MEALARARERYAAAALAAGCPADQVRRFVAAALVLQPRQLAAAAAARLCDRPCTHGPDEPCNDGCAPTKVGYGGARGGGKSHWGLAQVFCDDCARVPALKFLYLRKVGKAGKEAIEDLRRDVLHSTPHTYKQQQGVLIRRDNGSRVVLGHFQSEKDIDNYLGLQYDGALIEEATQLTRRKVVDIETCVRTTKEGWRPRLYFTTNPGNLGHAWFKSLFIKPFREKSERETRFIPATVYDNSFVNPIYRRSLEALTGWQRRAWLLGDWDIAAGQFFTTFRADTHVIEPFPIPSDWRVWMSLDYGIAHYTAVHVFAQSGDGDVYIIGEHGERGWIVERHADAIKAMLGRLGIGLERISGIYAGSDVFSKRHTNGRIADDYRTHGLKLRPANDDRINGAAEMMRRLGDLDAEIEPSLYIFNRCARLAENLPEMTHDPDRPEDVLKVDCDQDGQGGDDWYDSARYGVMAAVRLRNLVIKGNR
jgi:phage terminase large subunit